MNKTLLAAASLLSLAVAATPATAADLGKGFAVNGGAALVSDYRFRGISQTDKKFAVQGNFTVGHSSGFYGTVWGSSIDDYAFYGADQEIDFILGFKKTFGATTFDTGVLYYYYPGTPGIDTDFVEPYVAISQAFGPVTAKVSAAYAPKQNALAFVPGGQKQDNLYLAGDLSAAIPNTPVSLTAHLGRNFGPSYLVPLPDKGYTDWGVGASVAVKNITFGVNYVDTDTVFITPSGRDAAKSGVFGTVAVSF